MSSLGIFDKETKTYKKVADLSKPAVIDSAMSDTSTKAVQNKVVKSYVDGKFKQKVLARMYGDGKTPYCQLCTIKINEAYVNTPIEITLQERGRTTVDRLTVLFKSVDNNDPDLISFKVFGEYSNWYISKRAASTWVIYGGKSEEWADIKVVDYIGVDYVNVTWDVTGVTELPDSKTKAVWGGTVGHAVSADRVNNVDSAMSDTSTNPVQNKAVKSYVDNGLNTLKKSVSDGKTTVANAITAKGVTTATDATFATMANNISQIETGVDTSDANATAANILSGKTAYVNGTKVTGTMTNRGAERASLNCGDSYFIPGGYHNGNGKVTANSLASQTTATATADHILSGQTAWVNGTKITGTLGTRTTSFTKSTPNVLNAARDNLAGASVGDYALFAGGYTSTRVSTVDAYSSKLTKTTPSSLSDGRYHLAGASVGNYALFAGGETSSYSSVVDAYNSSLTRSTPNALTSSRGNLEGASVGNYALFAGGYVGTGTFRSTVDAYDSSLTRSTPTGLSVSRSRLAGASVGNYALFAGGYTGNYSSVVDAYNSSLARSTPTGLTSSRANLAGASVGNYALFAGGDNGSYSSTVNAYNSSLTRSTPTGLNTSRGYLAGVSVGNCVLFAGGVSNNGYTPVVDAYNSSLTRSIPSSLSVSRANLAGASVGNYALFAGGNNGSNSGTVDAYEPPHVIIPAQTIYL